MATAMTYISYELIDVVYCNAFNMTLKYAIREYVLHGLMFIAIKFSKYCYSIHKCITHNDRL